MRSFDVLRLKSADTLTGSLWVLYDQNDPQTHLGVPIRNIYITSLLPSTSKGVYMHVKSTQNLVFIGGNDAYVELLPHAVVTTASRIYKAGNSDVKDEFIKANVERIVIPRGSSVRLSLRIDRFVWYRIVHGPGGNGELSVINMSDRDTTVPAERYDARDFTFDQLFGQL